MITYLYDITTIVELLNEERALELFFEIGCFLENIKGPCIEFSDTENHEILLKFLDATVGFLR